MRSGDAEGQGRGGKCKQPGKIQISCLDSVKKKEEFSSIHHALRRKRGGTRITARRVIGDLNLRRLLELQHLVASAGVSSFNFFIEILVIYKAQSVVQTTNFQ